MKKPVSETRRWLDEMKSHRCDSSHQERVPDDGVWTLGYKCDGCGKRFSMLRVMFDPGSIGTPQ